MDRYWALQMQLFDTKDNYDDSLRYHDGSSVVARRPISVWGWKPGERLS